MNPKVHAEISVRAHGGVIDDYYAIHSFLDSTKELCSDNRHRILHTIWAVRQIVIPIFGHTIINSDGKQVNVKDLCERDHILPDYSMRFIPTLSDFVDTIDTSAIEGYQDKVTAIHKKFEGQGDIQKLLLSPLSVTGNLASLLLTHNSWFINEILPQIFDISPMIETFDLSPSTFFNAMSFELWMDNGSVMPPSAQRLTENQLIRD